MMTNTALQITLTAIGILGGLGLFAFGFGYLASQFKKGSKEKDSELMTNSDQIISFYKEQNENLKIMIDTKEKDSKLKDEEWNRKFTELNREVGTIKGQLDEKAKQADQYLEILQNRDPETKKFMEFVIKSCNDQGIINKQIVDVLKEIHTMAKAEHDRDFKINATVSKQ